MSSKKMLLYKNPRARLLHFLRMGINPFQKFVATGTIKEVLGLVNSREKLFKNIENVIEKNENFILPIIGDIGTGKTHLFWALKKKLYYHNTFYISLEEVYRKFYYNLYSELIEEMGIEVIRSITNKLCNNWGALSRRFGFFQVVDIEQIRKNAFSRVSEQFEDKIALMDAINVITAHQLDPYKRIEAERWLLGELMDIKELSSLNVMYDLRAKNNAFVMLKFLIENSKLGTVLFIDDFEKIITLMGEKNEEEEQIFDPGYLYGTSESPEHIAAKKVLNKILKLNSIRGLKIIITLKSIEALEEIKNKLSDINKKLLLTLKDPLFIENFTQDDVHELYKETMEHFIKNTLNYQEFYDNCSDPYYPLNKDVLNYVFSRTKGNPRSVIKFFINIFNQIINSDERLEDILINYS